MCIFITVCGFISSSPFHKFSTGVMRVKGLCTMHVTLLKLTHQTVKGVINYELQEPTAERLTPTEKPLSTCML